MLRHARSFHRPQSDCLTVRAVPPLAMTQPERVWASDVLDNKFQLVTNAAMFVATRNE